MNQKISTHLWFDREAKEAARFYTSVFPGSEIIRTTKLNGTPSGQVDMVKISLSGQEFTLISAGPLFKFNPSVSFHVSCSTEDETRAFWNKLSESGKVLMEFGSYPFSKLFGWTNDKYGLSWQIIFTGENSVRQKITPALMFTGKVGGQAEAAVNFYTSVFHDSRIDQIRRYGKNQEPEPENSVQYAAFTLENMNFGAMDSAQPHGFGFNESVSFMVHCDSQEQIDYYWDKLSADPKSEQCGWLKDKFGLSWQIVPVVLDQMLSDRNPENNARVTEAFLKMKKFDIAQLEKAYSQENKR
jgi:predicted 3-demethylubiquinone-9 3-methyltransferase (glyoxalase superfamily)